MKDKKYGFLRNHDEKITDADFRQMKKVTKEKSYTDNKLHLYLNLETRIVIRVILIILFSICSYYFIQKSYLVETESEIPYTEYGNVTYRVAVNDNEYYGEYLESGKQYVSDVVNTFESTFDYRLDLTKGMNYKYTYDLVGTLYIDSEDSGKNLVTNTYTYVDDKLVTGVDNTNISIQLPLNINFKEYNDFVKNYKRTYGVNVDSRLVVRLSFDYEGNASIFKEKKNKSSFVEMVIPLGEKETSATVNKIDKSDSFVETTDSELINDVLLSAGIVLLVFAVLVALSTAVFIVKVLPRKTKYCKKRDELLRNYDRVIVTSKKEPDIEGLKVVECNSFNELFDAQQSLDKPIVYYELVKNQKALFIIHNGSEVYRYVLKECDL